MDDLSNDALDALILEHDEVLDRRAADKAALEALARLDPLEYERRREGEAAKLDIRVAALDREVERLRKVATPGASTEGQGRALQLHEHEPWPEPVDGAALLAEIAATIRRFVVVPPAAADAVALWCAMSFCHDAFDVAPRLFIRSPTKGCGKSTMLDVVEHMAWRPLVCSSTTAAALFRAIEMYRPTVFLDEADTFVKHDNEDMRMVLNSGHRKRQAFVVRCVGEEHEPRQFSTWCPIVLAGIGRMPDTVEDRCIIVEMQRAAPGDRIEPLDERLLADVREVFAARGNPEFLSSTTVVNELLRLPDRPWSDVNRGKPLTTHRLARVLGKFGVVATKRETANGYLLATLLDPFDRYLPPSKFQTSRNPSNPPDSVDFKVPAEPSILELPNGQKPKETAASWRSGGLNGGCGDEEDDRELWHDDEAEGAWRYEH